MNKSTTHELIDNLTAFSRRFIEGLEGEWKAREEIAKTLISLSSVILVFTITLSPSLIKTNTPLVWRYAVVGCWLVFVSSLALSLASLWVAMGLTSLSVILLQRYQDFDDAVQEALQTKAHEPITAIYKQALGKVARQEKVALWLLRMSMGCFGSRWLLSRSWECVNCSPCLERHQSTNSPTTSKNSSLNFPTVAPRALVLSSSAAIFFSICGGMPFTWHPRLTQEFLA